MIKADYITKSFGSVQVLKGVSLEVAPAEVLCITGASGAGKTTLLQILGPLLRPDIGQVWIERRCGTKGQCRFQEQAHWLCFSYHLLQFDVGKCIRG